MIRRLRREDADRKVDARLSEAAVQTNAQLAAALDRVVACLCFRANEKGTPG